MKFITEVGKPVSSIIADGERALKAIMYWRNYTSDV
jgi:hypothetical protein